MKNLEIIKIKDDYYLIESAEIEHDSFGIQDVKINDCVLDIKNGEIGCVSHIGGSFNFKGTLQFPKHDDLHKNRHCTFNCRKVITSTNGINGTTILKFNFLEAII